MGAYQRQVDFTEQGFDLALTAIEMDRPLVHRHQRPVPYRDCSNNSSMRSWANLAISESQMS